MFYHLLASSFFKKIKFCLRRLAWLFLLVPVLSGFTSETSETLVAGFSVETSVDLKGWDVDEVGRVLDAFWSRKTPGDIEREFYPLNSGIPKEEAGFFHLNIGMLDRLDGDFNGSVEQLDKAKRAMRYAQEKLSEGNENSKIYAGTRVERVLLHETQTLNHLAAGWLHKARDEILEAEQLMGNPKEGIELASTRMLAGMVYELGKEYKLALASYRKALSVMDGRKSSPPTFLVERMIVLTDRFGLDGENGELKKRFKIDSVEISDRQVWVWGWRGVVSPLHARKVKVPGKESKEIEVALPVYEKQVTQWKPSGSLVDGRRKIEFKHWLEARTVENIDLRVREELKRQMPLLTERAIARKVAHEKEKAEKKEKIEETLVDDKAKPKKLFGKLLLAVANAISATADTRSWETLPSLISFTHIPLTSSAEKFTINWHPRSTAGGSEKKIIEVKGAKIILVVVHDVSAEILVSRY